MAKCAFCGRTYKKSDAREIVDERFYEGVYDYYYPNAEVCEDCASDVIGADMATGAEIAELMGDSWYDD